MTRITSPRLIAMFYSCRNPFHPLLWLLLILWGEIAFCPPTHAWSWPFQTTNAAQNTPANPQLELPDIDAPQVASPTYPGISLEPYNTGRPMLNLSQLTKQKQVRSPIMLSPQRDGYLFAEHSFFAETRQTVAELYWVPIQEQPSAQQQGQLAPTRYAIEAQQRKQDKKQSQRWGGGYRQPSIAEQHYGSMFDPDRQRRFRKRLYRVGYGDNRLKAFHTLVPVDFSANGEAVLVHYRTGVYNTGLKSTSSFLIVRPQTGQVTRYNELQSAIRSYWDAQGIMAPLDTVAWELFPLGWVQGSNRDIIVEAWAYDTKERQYLGVWRFDSQSEQSQLLSPTEVPREQLPLAQNGWRVSPKVMLDSSTGQWRRLGER